MAKTIAFVEDEIDDAQHRIESLRQIGKGRDVVRNAGAFDFSLRPYDALCYRGSCREKGARDFFGRESADLAQRQGHLRVG